MPLFTPIDIPNLAFWFEPRKGGTYQDSTGTTLPATITNDPVGYLPDWSGNNFHATQAGVTEKPTLQLTGLNSSATIKFDGSNDSLTLGNPAALNGASVGNYTATYCLFVNALLDWGTLLQRAPTSGGPQISTVYDWIGQNQISGAARPMAINFAFYCSGSSAQGQMAVATPYIITHRVTKTLPKFGAVTTESFVHEFFINGQLVSVGTVGVSTGGTTWHIGRRSDSALPISADLAAMMFFSRAITDSEIERLHSYLSTVFAVNCSGLSANTLEKSKESRVNLILDGNSLSSAATAFEGYYSLARPLITNLHNIHAPALDARSTTQLLTRIPTILAPCLDPTKLNIVSMWEITNDLNSGVSAATTYANVLTYCNTVKALGPNIRIIVWTPVARNFTSNQSTYEANRQTVMTSMRSNTSPPWDYLLDVGNPGSITIDGVSYNMASVGAANAQASTTYFYDAVHLTRSGNQIIAPAFAAMVNKCCNEFLEPTASIRRNANLIPALL